MISTASVDLVAGLVAVHTSPLNLTGCLYQHEDSSLPHSYISQRPWMWTCCKDSMVDVWVGNQDVNAIPLTCQFL